MKPKKIVLIRHGESVGNVDKQVYFKLPDFAVPLTEEGRRQAQHAGGLLAQVPTFFYVSPFRRTKETFENILTAFPRELSRYREEPRLREQEWTGSFRDPDDDLRQIETERESYSSFYYRFDRGESCADVYDRVSSFLNTLHRDFEKPEFPGQCVIVTHGMLIRVFLMRWFHWTVEEFELVRNPKNCCLVELDLNEGSGPRAGKYELTTVLGKHAAHTHPHHYPL